jgi:hypothetical protein
VSKNKVINRFIIYERKKRRLKLWGIHTNGAILKKMFVASAMRMKAFANAMKTASAKWMSVFAQMNKPTNLKV